MRHKYADRPILTSTFVEAEKNRLVGVFCQEVRPSLDGPKERVHILKLRSSTSYNGREDTWVLQSSGCRASVIQYLFHKWLFQSLTRREWELFCEFPETVRDPLIYSALRASKNGYSQKVIRKSLKFASPLLNRRMPSLERWLGYRSFLLSFEKRKHQKSTQAVQKYTGWRRHQNDQGSMAPPREDPYFLEPLIENDFSQNFLNICKMIENGQSTIFINELRIILR